MLAELFSGKHSSGCYFVGFCLGLPPVIKLATPHELTHLPFSPGAQNLTGVFISSSFGSVAVCPGHHQHLHRRSPEMWFPWQRWKRPRALGLPVGSSLTPSLPQLSLAWTVKQRLLSC